MKQNSSSKGKSTKTTGKKTSASSYTGVSSRGAPERSTSSSRTKAAASKSSSAKTSSKSAGSKTASSKTAVKSSSKTTASKTAASKTSVSRTSAVKSAAPKTSSARAGNVKTSAAKKSPSKTGSVKTSSPVYANERLSAPASSNGNVNTNHYSGSKNKGGKFFSNKGLLQAKAKSGKVKMNTKAVVVLCTIIVLFCAALIMIAVLNGKVSQASEDKASQITNAIEQKDNLIPADNSASPKTDKAKTDKSKVNDKLDRKKSSDNSKASDSEKNRVDSKASDTSKSSDKSKASDSAESSLTNDELSLLNETLAISELPDPLSTDLSVNNAAASVTADKKTSAVELTPSASVLPSSSKTSVSSGGDSNKNAESLVPYAIPPAKNNATLIFVIDDAGYNVANVKAYASLPFPITIAVLPKLAHSKDAAYVVRANKKELILHQPMQSTNLKLNPGPGAITPDMTSAEIAALVKENLDEIGPEVKGLNNHEGSLITEDLSRIGTVLDVAKERKIYFLDSRTTVQTKAPQAASSRSMSIKERDVFIDDIVSREEMLAQIYRGLDIANKNGKVIMIGHVDKSVKILPDLLRDMYPYLIAKGYKFAVPSQM
jgi:polysaccharide deacetylase 2 family uncharacterized protein YibQ